MDPEGVQWCDHTPPPFRVDHTAGAFDYFFKVPKAGENPLSFPPCSEVCPFPCFPPPAPAIDAFVLSWGWRKLWSYSSQAAWGLDSAETATTAVAIAMQEGGRLRWGNPHAAAATVMSHSQLSPDLVSLDGEGRSTCEVSPTSRTVEKATGPDGGGREGMGGEVMGLWPGRGSEARLLPSFQTLISSQGLPLPALHVERMGDWD